jgi:hypothetical protein
VFVGAGKVAVRSYVMNHDGLEKWLGWERREMNEYFWKGNVLERAMEEQEGKGRTTLS